MPKCAALFVNGRLFTGCHHGDAFSKLNSFEKTKPITSGFYDPQNNKFICDEQEFYLKKIIMVRHAQAEDEGNDPGITDVGRLQVKQAATFFRSFINLKDFVGLASPMKRCQETAEVFCNESNINFDVDEDLLDNDGVPESMFVSRLSILLDRLPTKSFLISHCNFIAKLTQLATGINTAKMAVPNCSITFIENNTVAHIGKVGNNEENLLG